MFFWFGVFFLLDGLGPGTVFCDNLSYIFMFLSIATSNMVATSLAKKVSSLSSCWKGLIVDITDGNLDSLYFHVKYVVFFFQQFIIVIVML